MSTDLMQTLKVAALAGDEIMKIYNDKDRFENVDFKADNSPLTLADKASHEIIASNLTALYPQIPIISEEGQDIPNKTRRFWNLFWLVDPLDGTKEFIKRNGEFTVNIALIENGYPVFGVIYVPEKDVFYYSDKHEAFKKVTLNGLPNKLNVNGKYEKLIAVKSRSHSSDEENEVLDTYDIVDSVAVGSSLKFCMIAEGRADIYYRHGPTMEWDIAAGQSILEAAGGTVVRFDGKERFYYNKESLRNDSFLCLGKGDTR